MAGETKDVWVALMGVTGSGKSTFISHCTGQKATVGNGLQSCTRNVEVYSFTYRPGLTVHLVDTPGFDDTNRQDGAVLGEISGWLSKTYTEQIYLSGILYFHRISDIRMQGTGKMNMWLLRKLCGRGAVNKVVLTTTMWELVEESTAEQRLKELEETEEFWGYMKKNGAGVHRHYNNKESALNVLSRFVPQELNVEPEVIKLAIQTELADDHKTLDQTGAGKMLNAEWAQEKESLENELVQVREAIKTATQERDLTMAKLLQEQQEEMKQSVERMRIEQEKLRVTMEQLHAERLAKMREMLEQQRDATESLNADLREKERQRQQEQKRHEEEKLRNKKLAAEQQKTIRGLTAKLSPAQSPSAAEPPPWTPPASEAHKPAGTSRYFEHTHSQDTVFSPHWTLDFTPDGKKLIAGHNQKMISIFSRNDQGQYHITQEFKCWSTSKWKRKKYSRIAVTMRPDGRTFATSADNRRIQIYELDGSGMFRQIQKLDQKAMMMASTPDGEYLVSVTNMFDGKVQVWKGFNAPLTMRCVEEKMVEDLGGSVAKHMVLSSDGRLALVVSDKVILCALDKATGTLTETQVLPSDLSTIERLAWAPDGRTLASSGSRKEHVEIWTTGHDGQMQRAAKLDMPFDWCRRMCFSPDGNSLAIAYEFQGWCMWMRDERSQDGWTMVLNRLADQSDPKAMAFHPDGKSIVLAYMKSQFVWSIVRK
ncbi:G domain-containing protein [Fusarium keratoplasticum]|nr:G domain-containing protein [Fusarium keratoplasticum]